MPIDFQSRRVDFSPATGGPRQLPIAFEFATPIRNAVIAVNGFEFGFSDDDHHLFRQQIEAKVVSVSGNTLAVNVLFALRDSSGTFDDRYDGHVDVVAIVDRI